MYVAYVNVLDPSKELEYKGQYGNAWVVDLHIRDGQPQIFVPRNSATQ